MGPNPTGRATFWAHELEDLTTSCCGTVVIERSAVEISSPSTSGGLCFIDVLMQNNNSNPGQNCVRPRPRRTPYASKGARRLSRLRDLEQSRFQKRERLNPVREGFDSRNRRPRQWAQSTTDRYFGRVRTRFEQWNDDFWASLPAPVTEPPPPPPTLPAPLIAPVPVVVAVADPVVVLPPPPPPPSPPRARTPSPELPGNLTEAYMRFVNYKGRFPPAPAEPVLAKPVTDLSPLRDPAVCNCCLGTGKLTDGKCSDFLTPGKSWRGSVWTVDASKGPCSLCDRCCYVVWQAKLADERFGYFSGWVYPPPSGVLSKGSEKGVVRYKNVRRPFDDLPRL